MRRIVFTCFMLFLAELPCIHAFAQYPNNPGGIPPITGSGGRTPQQEEIPSAPPEVKPDKAAAKAYTAGMKSMGKAKEIEEAMAKTSDADKKAGLQQKLDDMYGRALEQFTDVLRNKDMYEAWNKIGFIHLHFGAYRESIDDYNHTLSLKPDLQEAIEHRGEAYMGVDHLDEAKAAYMDLFFHDRPLADQMMATMQAWLQNHRASANGVRTTDIDAFDKWLQEREGIAKTTAAN